MVRTLGFQKRMLDPCLLERVVQGLRALPEFLECRNGKVGQTTAPASA
jgi:hypothetical protein